MVPDIKVSDLIKALSYWTESDAWVGEMTVARHLHDADRFTLNNAPGIFLENVFVKDGAPQDRGVPLLTPVHPTAYIRSPSLFFNDLDRNTHTCLTNVFLS